jgi:hypothetical protein
MLGHASHYCSRNATAAMRSHHDELAVASDIENHFRWRSFLNSIIDMNQRVVQGVFVEFIEKIAFVIVIPVPIDCIGTIQGRRVHVEYQQVGTVIVGKGAGEPKG